MILRRRVALNWRHLDEIDPRILIQGSEPQAGRETTGTASLWGGVGSRVTGEHRESLDVNVQFSLDIKRAHFEERAFVLEQIMTWAAAGGWLTLSQKPGRRLRVYAAQLPAEGDPLDWTQRYTITFRALGVPYWQRDAANTVTLSGASASGVLSVTGNVATDAELLFKNTSGSVCNTVTVTAGDSTMALTDLGLASGETLWIDHDDDGRRCVLRIRIEDTNGVMRSAYSCRTPDSSDELRVTPGVQPVTLTAQRAGILKMSCYGRFA